MLLKYAFIHCIKRQTINCLQNIISFNLAIYYNQNYLKEYTNISNHLSFFSTVKNTCAYKNLFKNHWRYQWTGKKFLVPIDKKYGSQSWTQRVVLFQYSSGKHQKPREKYQKLSKVSGLKRPHQRCFDRVVTTTLTIENEDCELAVATFC